MWSNANLSKVSAHMNASETAFKMVHRIGIAEFSFECKIDSNHTAANIKKSLSLDTIQESTCLNCTSSIQPRLNDNYSTTTSASTPMEIRALLNSEWVKARLRVEFREVEFAGNQ